MAAGDPVHAVRRPSGRARGGDAAVGRHRLDFYCANGHATALSFADGADLPELWDCPRCGLPAGLDPVAPPQIARNEPYKTHLAYVKERRSDEDGEALLAEALARVAGRGRADRPAAR